MKTRLLLLPSSQSQISKKGGAECSPGRREPRDSLLCEPGFSLCGKNLFCQGWPWKDFLLGVSYHKIKIGSGGQERRSEGVSWSISGGRSLGGGQVLDTAGAGVTPRKNFPAAYTPSFRWPVLPSGDAPCLLGWEGLSAQHFAFLPPLQGFSASALLTPGGGRFLAGGACPVHCWTFGSIPGLYQIDARSNPTPTSCDNRKYLSRHCHVSPWSGRLPPGWDHSALLDCF